MIKSDLLMSARLEGESGAAKMELWVSERTVDPTRQSWSWIHLISNTWEIRETEGEASEM